MKYPTYTIASPSSVDALLTKASGTSPVKEEIRDNMKAFSSSTATVRRSSSLFNVFPSSKGPSSVGLPFRKTCTDPTTGAHF